MTLPYPDAREWFNLDLRLQLVGAEERRRWAVRAWRDPDRPRIWDRHLAIPTAEPDDVEHELRALDSFYREIGAEQWSLVGLQRQPMLAWQNGLAGFDLHDECRALMHKPVVGGELPAGVINLESPERDRLLSELRQTMTAADPSSRLDHLVLHQLGEVMRLGEKDGQKSVVLAYREQDELVAYLMFTVVGKFAWMEDLETRADRRGHGFAHALMRATDVVAHGLGARWTGFYASEDNWPKSWYERLGWRVVARSIRLRRMLS